MFSIRKVAPKWKRVKDKFAWTQSPSPGPAVGHKPQANQYPHENQITPPTPISRPQAKRAKKKKSDVFGCWGGYTSSEDDDSYSSTPTNVFIDLAIIPCFCTTLATYKTICSPENPPNCSCRLTSADKNEQQLSNPVRLISPADLITTFTNIQDQLKALLF